MDKNSTDALAAKVLSLYKRGFSCKDIAQTCKLPLLIVRKYLQEAGYDTRSYRKASDVNKVKVLLLMKAGYSYTQIEDLLHVSTHLIREIVAGNGLVGVAPRYHHPIELKVDANRISAERLQLLRESYLSGEYGLAKCSEIHHISDDEFLWFVYHLTKEDRDFHCKQLKSNIRKMFKAHIPVAAIAKAMDVSPAIVKKQL